MHSPDSPFEDLAGVEEPGFSARLLFHLITRSDDFRDALLSEIYQRADLPADIPTEASVFLNDQRARLVHHEKVAPLNLCVRRAGFSASIGINCLCAEPFSSVNPFPVAIGDRHLISALIVPRWRMEVTRRHFRLAGGPRLCVMDLYDLSRIIEHTLTKLDLAEVPLLCARYFRRRDIVSTGPDGLAHWLPHTLETHGTPAHWSLLRKLRDCFDDADRELTVNRGFLGFSFRLGGKRGWLSFNEAHGEYPSGRNVALVLSLPYRIRPANPRLFKLPRLMPGLPESSAGEEWRHWEIGYSLDWDNFEPWVKCLSGLIT